MIVRHERSGGFAGITINAEVDSETLTARQASELKRLVEKAFPSDQPADKTEAEKFAMPDQFNYGFVIEDGTTSQTHEVTDESITDEMRTLSKWLITTAQKKKH